MPDSSQDALPSSARLARATVGAIVVAAVLLVTIVMPAEFGRDPTGAGAALGLFRRPVETPTTEPLTSEGVEAAGSPLVASATPYRTDEMTLVLKSGEGAEIKAAMNAGDRMVFSWTATGAGVDVDMHGEAAGGAEGQATSYRKGEWQTSGHGAFAAPFAGNHGWFWQNLNDDPVTVTVKVSGFHQKLFRP